MNEERPYFLIFSMKTDQASVTKLLQQWDHGSKSVRSKILHRHNIGICSLNNCSLDDPCSDEAILIWVPGCTFHQLEQNKV